MRLFDRSQEGYRLSEAGTEMLAQAERVAVEADTLARLMMQRGRGLSGVIRVTTPEAIANAVLTPWLGEFMELYPDIRVELIAMDRKLDLSRGEADIALRAGHMPTEAGIVVRKLSDCPWGLYCSKAYADKRGTPRCLEELNEHLLVGADGWLATLEPYEWIAKAAPRAKIRSISSTVINMVYAIKAGHGASPLPSMMAAMEPDLVECFPLPQLKYFYFLATRESLKDVPRVKAFNDFVVSRAAAFKHVLLGRPAGEQ